MLSRNSLTDIMEKPARSSRRKEEARQIEFIRIGQALKLETIVKVAILFSLNRSDSIAFREMRLRVWLRLDYTDERRGSRTASSPACPLTSCAAIHGAKILL